MARLLIYDAYENKVYTYANLNENDPMPYSTLTTLRLREFRGKSASPTLWTTIAAMEAWNLTRRKYGSGIPVGYAFRRIWEGGHGTRSQHYAGVSFDVGQTLSQRQRTAIFAQRFQLIGLQLHRIFDRHRLPRLDLLTRLRRPGHILILQHRWWIGFSICARHFHRRLTRAYHPFAHRIGDQRTDLDRNVLEIFLQACVIA